MPTSSDKQVPDHADDEEEVIKLSESLRHTTILWIERTKRLYKSSKKDGNSIPLLPHDIHAETKFIQDCIEQNTDMREIKSMHIKNSPCDKCADDLMKAFEMSPTKPIIYVGRIYNLTSLADKAKLEELIAAGFDMRVWEGLNERIKTKEKDEENNKKDEENNKQDEENNKQDEENNKQDEENNKQDEENNKGKNRAHETSTYLTKLKQKMKIRKLIARFKLFIIAIFIILFVLAIYLLLINIIYD
jgi:hypothetical protein